MSCSVLIPQDVAEEAKEWLRRRGYEIRMGRGAAVEQMERDIVECDAMLARTALVPARVLEAGRKLKVIGRHGVGYDNIDVARATELGIWVTYAPESNADTVAEYTIGCIVALARNLALADRELRRGNWVFRNEVLGSDLMGKVLGIAGFGRVGGSVAKKAALGLDMKVLAYDPHLPGRPVPEYVTSASSRDELFSAADFVTLHIPGGLKTRGSVGRREFSMMKKTAYIINASRGEIIEENDLVRALWEGVIAGAALDVYAKEPPDPDNPLLTMDNVLLTPHNAANTRECMVRMALDAARGIDEVLSGKRPTWPVNEIV